PHIVLTPLYLTFLYLCPPLSLSSLFPYTTLFRSILRLRHQSRRWAQNLPDHRSKGLLRPAHPWQPLRLRSSRTHRHRVSGRSSRSEEHTSELQSRFALVCRLLLEKNNHTISINKC